jgi:hypothetical protein
VHCAEAIASVSPQPLCLSSCEETTPWYYWHPLVLLVVPTPRAWVGGCSCSGAVPLTGQAVCGMDRSGTRVSVAEVVKAYAVAFVGVQQVMTAADDRPVPVTRAGISKPRCTHQFLNSGTVRFRPTKTTGPKTKSESGAPFLPRWFNPRVCTILGLAFTQISKNTVMCRSGLAICTSLSWVSLSTDHLCRCAISAVPVCFEQQSVPPRKHVDWKWHSFQGVQGTGSLLPTGVADQV